MKKIKYPGELSQHELDPIVKELKQVHRMNKVDIYNFVNSELGSVEDTLKDTNFKVLRDERRIPFTIVKRYEPLAYMTTEELIMRVQDLGLAIVHQEDGNIEIMYDDYTIAITYDYEQYAMSQYGIEDGEDPEVIKELYYTLTRYANTPVEKR